MSGGRIAAFLRIVLLACACSAGACKSAGAGDVPEAEAREFKRKLRTIALAEADQRMKLLALLCSDLRGCAAECPLAFRAFADEPELDRGEAMLSTCHAFGKYAKDADFNELPGRSRDWVHIELRRYALQVEKALGPEGARTLETLDGAIAGEPPYWEK